MFYSCIGAAVETKDTAHAVVLSTAAAVTGYVLAGLEVIGVLGVGYGELVDVHGADRYLLRVRALREPAKAQASKQEPFSPK